MNEKDEEQTMDVGIPEEEFKLPAGSDPVKAIEDYFGTTATAHKEMPDDADVEGTVLIRFN